MTLFVSFPPHQFRRYFHQYLHELVKSVLDLVNIGQRLKNSNAACVQVVRLQVVIFTCHFAHYVVKNHTTCNMVIVYSCTNRHSFTFGPGWTYLRNLAPAGALRDGLIEGVSNKRQEKIILKPSKMSKHFKQEVILTATSRRTQKSYQMLCAMNMFSTKNF